MKKFLKTLYKNVDGDGYVSVWNKETKNTEFFAMNEISKIPEYVKGYIKNADMYFGVCPRKESLVGRRGNEGDTLCLPSLYFDFDLMGPHKKQNLPEDWEALEPFINSLPVQPSIVVNSGHGIHAYWILREPISDLVHAKEFLWGWNLYIIEKGREVGWELDNVGELARVLRLPETLNHKTQPAVDVKTIYIDEKSEYNESDFEEFIILESEEIPEYSTGFEMPETVGEGKRNDLLFRYACMLRRKGMSEKEIAASLDAVNEERVNPPLTKSEVRTIIKSAAKYPAGSLAPVSDDLPSVDIQSIQSAEELLSEPVLRRVLKIQNELKQHQKLTELKSKARAMGVTVADFNQTINIIKKTIAGEAAAYANEDVPAIELPVNLSIPDGWNVDEVNGVFRLRTIKGVTVKDWACGHPVIVTDRLSNVDTGTEKLKIQFKRDGAWKERIVPRSVLASRQGIINLADAGVMVHAENAKHLIQYLSDFEYRNIDEMSKSKSVGRLGWIGSSSFSPYSTDIVFDGEQGYETMFNAIKPGGDYDTWRKEALAARKKHVARTVLAASFASPCLMLLDKPIFFVHLWGQTGIGKTVASMLAMSVWGNPEALLKSFNSTIVGFEKNASFFCHLPLCLDELQTCRNKEMLDYVIYSLSEGRSKGRGNKGGTSEIISSWRNIIITNGEEPITNDKSGGGAKNRVIEFYSSVPLFEDSASTAETVIHNYGYAGEEFIGQLMAMSTKELNELYAQFRKVVKDGKYSTRYEDKQLNALAILGMGDYLSAKFVFGFKDDEALASAYEFVETISSDLTALSDIDQVERAHEMVNDWLVSNRAHFLESVSLLSPRYGVIREEEYCVMSTILSAELEKMGFSPKKIIKGFAEKGYLEMRNPNSYSDIVKIDGAVVRCYRFSGINADENVEATEEQVPF